MLLSSSTTRTRRLFIGYHSLHAGQLEKGQTYKRHEAFAERSFLRDVSTMHCSNRLRDSRAGATGASASGSQLRTSSVSRAPHVSRVSIDVIGRRTWFNPHCLADSLRTGSI